VARRRCLKAVGGFFQLISGPAELDVDAFGGRGALFRIHRCGLKSYPVVIYSQTAIVAGIKLAKENRHLDRITAVEIATTRRGLQHWDRPRERAPANRATADHSLPYIAARAMFDGDLINDSYTPKKLHDPRIPPS
jgi:2-methylcitrate dehydratase